MKSKKMFFENLPLWAKYVAQDQDGAWCAFNKKPHLKNGVWDYWEWEPYECEYLSVDHSKTLIKIKHPNKNESELTEAMNKAESELIKAIRKLPISQRIALRKTIMQTIISDAQHNS